MPAPNRLAADVPDAATLIAAGADSLVAVDQLQISSLLILPRMTIVQIGDRCRIGDSVRIIDHQTADGAVGVQRDERSPSSLPRPAASSAVPSSPGLGCVRSRKSCGIARSRRSRGVDVRGMLRTPRNR